MTKASPLIFSFIKESDVEEKPRTIKLEVYRDTLMKRIGDVQRADSVLTNVYLGQPEITDQAAVVPTVEMEDIKNPVEAPLTMAVIDTLSTPIGLSGIRDQVAYEQAAAYTPAEPVEVPQTILAETLASEEETSAQQIAYVDALSAARNQVNAAFDTEPSDTLAYEDMSQKDFGLAR